MKKQGRFSTKMIILIPVFVLGIVSIISSILAVRNIRKVNANATQIANGYMVCIADLERNGKNSPSWIITYCCNRS